jgi:hypothetical protein
VERESERGYPLQAVLTMIRVEGRKKALNVGNTAVIEVK